LLDPTFSAQENVRYFGARVASSSKRSTESATSSICASSRLVSVAASWGTRTTAPSLTRKKYGSPDPSRQVPIGIRPRPLELVLRRNRELDPDEGRCPHPCDQPASSREGASESLRFRIGEDTPAFRNPGHGRSGCGLLRHRSPPCYLRELTSDWLSAHGAGCPRRTTWVSRVMVCPCASFTRCCA